MTKQETAKLIAMLKEYYPRDYESTDIMSRVNAWHMILQDYDYKEATAALLAFVSTDTKGFSPTVGQLIDKMQWMRGSDELTEGEAWTLVSRATRNGAYRSVEEFERLPEQVQRVVGNPAMLKAWSQLPTEEVETVIQSNFMRSYRARVKSDKEFEAIPMNVKTYIENNMRSLGIEDELVKMLSMEE